MSARDALFGFVAAGAEEEDLPTFAAALDAYAAEVRAAALHEAADVVFGVAEDMRECDGTYPDEWSSRDVRDAVDAAGEALRRMAEEAPSV